MPCPTAPEEDRAMKSAALEEKYVLHTAGSFFLLILAGIMISAIRLNFYM